MAHLKFGILLFFGFYDNNFYEGESKSKGNF